jgi:hypothetical protein
MRNAFAGSVRFARVSGRAGWCDGPPVLRPARHQLALSQEDVDERADRRGCLGGLLLCGPGFLLANDILALTGTRFHVLGMVAHLLRLPLRTAPKVSRRGLPLTVYLTK